ncbi:HAD hydrolase family protein [Ruminococcus sp.]|uniref:HAD family hydrolase n=1 Tax=Ruminococcus sp. TaxID=41978 RepID=UPI0025F9DF41|nr:HAD hydrolase family protein [Ruminococcus sp.]MBQ8967908.1 HAD hydrolase family protein [Ruminococcus sp.]
MSKILLACDLDNTLIHSYKHKRQGDICVEILRGNEQGFMSSRVYDKLSHLPESIELVPLTTRSVEQFERIKLPAGSHTRAITTNGGILIENGVQNEKWREKHLRCAAELMPLLKKLHAELEGDPLLNVVRIVDDMYLYISCSDPSYVGKFMDRYESIPELDVMASGRKIYFLPPKINKGSALHQLAEKEEFPFTAAAGDSTIDLPMLEQADHAIIPESLDKLLKNPSRSVYRGDGDLAEFVVDTLAGLLDK